MQKKVATCPHKKLKIENHVLDVVVMGKKERAKYQQSICEECGCIVKSVKFKGNDNIKEETKE